MNNYGEKIKIARTNKKLTQKQLADMIGVSNNLICKWESNDRTPKAIMLERLSEVLDVDYRYFSSIKEELIPLLLFKEIEKGKVVFEYDDWNDKPVYKNILVNLVNNNIFEEDVRQLFQREIDKKYYAYQSKDNKTHIIKTDFRKIIDGRLYAIILDDELVLGQLFNYKNGEFFAIIIDQEKLIKQAAHNVIEGKEPNELDGEAIIRKFFSAEDRDKISGIVISSIVSLE